MKGIFITGTDTNIGKTIISSLLCSALQELKMNPAYFKPIQTGLDDDCESVKCLSGLSSDAIEKPVYQFNEPISPNRAALLNRQEIKVSKIIDKWESLPERFYVVEGAGGAMVPINENETIRDMIAALELSTPIVASTRLGTINHTLLTVEALFNINISIAGIILCGPPDAGLKEVIEQQSKQRVLAEVPHFETISRNVIKEFGQTMLNHEFRKSLESTS